MVLTPGTRLGPYEVLSAIGAGGMGEVYRARDTKLNRDVALKILPANFAADPDRLARFHREAQVLAALNHAHIGAIYGFEDSADTHALVLEFVDGPTLADRIAQGPIPIDDALAIAKQVAGALEGAHEQGIIHRDLKPANIKLRPDGTVKVLDFGLAKLNEPNVPNGPNDANAFSMSPTVTSPAMMTGVGVLLGTAAYMSPEQAKGRAVDKRSDIWAFGCVLFEMLTGRRAFPGEDASDTVAAILRGDPDLNNLPRATPAHIRTLLSRCLEKDSQRRLRDIGEARILIEAANKEGTEPSPVSGWTGNRIAAVMMFVALVAVSSGILIGYANRGNANISNAVVRFSLFPPEGTTFSAIGLSRFSLSADGRQIAAVVESAGRGTSVWVQPLDALTARELPGTEGAIGTPFWSPDGNTVAFFADGKLRRIDVNATVARTLCELPTTRQRQQIRSTDRGTWSKDLILFSSGGRIFRIPATGGNPSPVTTSDEVKEPHSNPTFLPDGRQFLFDVTGPVSKAGVWVGSVDGAPPTRILEGASRLPTLAPPYLLFIRDGALMAQAFDATRYQLSGEARPIAETARFDVQPNVSASETGVLAYSTGLTPDRQLQWVDRLGRELTKVLEPAPWGNFDLSPDGNRVVVSLARAGRFGDIWSLDLTRGVQTRLTFLDVQDNSPIWSPDGRRIAFTQNEGPGQSQVIIMSASGGNETVLNAAHGQLDDWSPDGRFITFNSDPSLSAVPTDGSGKVLTFARTAAANFDESHFSPDGKWIAYNSNASGTWEVYLSHFPSTDERWQISPNGGAEVRWRSDGKELYYLGLDGQMMAVDVQLGSDVVLSPPRALFQSGIVVNPRTDEYAVSADGQRFLLSRQVVGGSRFPLTIVLNWPALLKQ